MTYEEETWVAVTKELLKLSDSEDPTFWNPIDLSEDAFYLLIKYRLFRDNRFWNWFEYYLDSGKSDIEAARVAITRTVAESANLPPA